MGIKITSPGGVSSATDDAYVNVVGDEMSGDLEITDTTKGVILKDSSGGRWRVTIGTSGALITSQIVAAGSAGEPMGLLLCLTYSS